MQPKRQKDMQKKQYQLSIRKYKEEDYIHIQQLNEVEQWTNLAERAEEGRAAWKCSGIALVAEHEEVVVGYIRGMTDRMITLYVCELLVKREYRRLGIGEALLKQAHSLCPETRVELLASASSKTYYEQLGFRPFNGYRITMQEWEK